MPSERTSLDGRTAIVTGGGGSIGAAIAVRLARAGANVVIAQRSAASARQVVDRIEEIGGAAAYVPTDVSLESDVSSLVDATVERFGGAEIVVNNAAHPGKASAAEMSREQWEAIIATNLTGPFRLAQHAQPSMRAAGYGRIINIGAIQAYSPLDGAVAYASAKAGMNGLTRTLAHEWSGDGITTNTLHVGAIYSADWVADETEIPADRPIEERYEQVPPEHDQSAATLVDRLGTPGEVAGFVRYLASPEAGFITGQVMVCDGGRLVSRDPEPFDQSVES